jgi:elongation factor 1-gamma
VQEVLFTARVAGAPLTLENLPWTDEERRAELKSTTPTGTFPYLQTPHGILSESRAINQYIADSYKAELLGSNSFEKAQVRQWVEFATTEITECSKSVLYPILGFDDYEKAKFDEGSKEIKEHLKILNKHLEGKTYVVGSNITLADITLFATLRQWFQLQFVEGIRKTVFPHITSWIVNIANSENAQKVYGRFVLCKVGLKALVPEKKADHVEVKEKNKDKKDDGDDDDKPKTKTVNPLETLPPTTFDLDGFKRDFLNTDDKRAAMDRLWKNWDANGFSFWFMQYQRLASEGKILFKTNNSCSFFLQKLDSFRKYSFSAYGVYGEEGNYEIRGVWMWRGTDIPDEVKSHDSFPYLTVKKLEPTNETDRKLIEEYWMNINVGDKVDGMVAAEVQHFK